MIGYNEFGHPEFDTQRSALDELVFVIGVNSVANTPAKVDIAPLYETVFRILEPQSVVDPNTTPSPSLAQHDLAP